MFVNILLKIFFRNYIINFLNAVILFSILNNTNNYTHNINYDMSIIILKSMFLKPIKVLINSFISDIIKEYCLLKGGHQ